MSRSDGKQTKTDEVVPEQRGRRQHKGGIAGRRELREATEIGEEAASAEEAGARVAMIADIVGADSASAAGEVGIDIVGVGTVNAGVGTAGMDTAGTTSADLDDSLEGTRSMGIMVEGASSASGCRQGNKLEHR
ncbi:unnamed protein product [Ilex paraguariensis]|uniref:Uncharacterized protein n=1 Tax=Ilex paraguariensis TaxID=185542 RepID=A0ABC8RFZ4_9AQUA